MHLSVEKDTVFSFPASCKDASQCHQVKKFIAAVQIKNINVSVAKQSVNTIISKSKGYRIFV
jgi:hypothetical protein